MESSRRKSANGVKAPAQVGSRRVESATNRAGPDINPCMYLCNYAVFGMLHTYTLGIEDEAP